MRVGLLLALVCCGVVVSQDSPHDPINPEKLKPEFVELKIYGMVDDMISGELSFEKAYLEFTDHMNGYGVFLAHSCDEFITLLDAQSDSQNPEQAKAEDIITQKEKDDENATTPEEAEKGLVHELNALWDTYWRGLPEALIPVGWREQMEAVQTPSMVDSALQPDVIPFLQFMKNANTPRYSTIFKGNVPSRANVMVLYGGEYMPDPLHQLKIDAGKIKKGTLPKQIFVPLSRPVVLPIKKEDEKGLYYTPLSPKFEGKVENDTVNGVLTFAGAFYENWMKGYVVLFGTGPHAWQRIGTEFSVVHGIIPMGRRFSDGRYEVHFRNVTIAPRANHILIFGGHPHNCNKPAAINLFPVKVEPEQAVDPVVPDATTPEKVQFISSGPTSGQITGTLVFEPAADEDNGLGYVVQFASNQTIGSRVPLYGGNPYTDFNVAVMFKSGVRKTYQYFIERFPVPRGATFLRISQFSHYDPEANPKSNVSPYGTPAFVPLTGGMGSN